MQRKRTRRLWSVGAALSAVALSTPAAHAIVTVGSIKTPTTNSRPTTTAVAPNGTIWFTEEAANKLGYIDPNGGVVNEYTWTTQNVRPNALAIDGSGRIWFTEANVDRIGMYNPASNSLIEYSWGGANLGFSGIEVTTDGRVWFTMTNQNAIGVLDPGLLTIRYYRWTSTPLGLLRIKRDGYNRLWFTENRTNRVGVLDPYRSYVYDYYWTGSVSGPWGIAVDANQKVWFTENQAGTFSRLDPSSGVTNEWIGVGGTSSAPRDIATAQNASGQTVVVWAESSGAGNVGVLNAATGNKIGVALSPSSEATGIAIDSQRGAWFTETGLWQLSGFSLLSTDIARRPRGGGRDRLLFAEPFTISHTSATPDYQVMLIRHDDDNGNGNGNNNGRDKEDKGKNRDKQARLDSKKADIEEHELREVKEQSPKKETRKYR